ncbi:SMI1/KNR4 family protein [Thermosynechococcus sp. QKsg1]|uniref:SMI1/KNR4 family protein n=1 Tax=Thermosynechococcus sp. QKsg1 TaxID=3074130 RepID=UPI002878075E|nr:SMI1/KNR4 family protein [Thermosynechococcus sp. QKsg1]WNC86604.1 SMI1/KNR4 family protein [Thermosynechococcus sp. QKsg1]
MSIHESLAIILDWMRNHAPNVLEGLNPPASAAEIARVESAIGLPLPPCFKEFLSLHNGESGIVGALLGDGNKLLSCDDIIQQYELDQDIGRSCQDPDFFSISFWKSRVASQVIFIKGAVKPLIYHPHWIPITCMNGDILRYINLDPAPTGTIGQVIEVCDENCSYEVLANSFEELLSHDAQQLIAGDYQFNPEYEEIMLQTPKNILE